MQTLESCSCFALGRKQVKREKEQKSAIFTVNKLYSSRSPAPGGAQTSRAGCAGRQGAA